MMKVRTRFAPSPTGYMHIGNLRTALYAWLFARKNNGDFILRIEDTDRNRLVEEAGDVIFRTLRDTGLSYNEGPDVGGAYGPYVQSERKEIYGKYARLLVEKGAAYYCFCTKERLDGLREQAAAEGKVFKYDKHCMSLSKEEVERRIAAGEEYVIRQNIPLEGESSYEDAVYGTITVPMSDMEDNILLKSDGWPTYNLANVIDDHLMEITHVIRGIEYLSSTPKYNLLYDALGWQRPTYIHLPPVMKDKQKKLSKRNGDASYEDLIAKGYLKEAILNYIALLGWNPGGEREIFSLEELAQVFSLEGLSKSSAIFDMEKLTWMNGEYIRALSPEAFLERARPYLQAAITREMNLAKLAALIQPRLETLTQIADKVGFFNALPEYDLALYTHKKMKTTAENSLDILVAARQALAGTEAFTNDALYAALLSVAEQAGVKSGRVLWPVRIAITGTAVTPGGATEIAELLGKEETLARMDTSIAKLQRELA
jgi:glutamyl-tRNA synthetase